MKSNMAIKAALYKIVASAPEVDKDKLVILEKMFISGDIPAEEIVAFSNYVERHKNKIHILRWRPKFFIHRYKVLWEAVEYQYSVTENEKRAKILAEKHKKAKKLAEKEEIANEPTEK